MPENTTTTQTTGQSQQTTQQTQGTQQTQQTALPEKFQGKSAEEIYKSYAELESKLGETSSKYKDYDDYAKIGKPSEITEAIEWARNIKAAMDKGELIAKGAAPKTQTQTQQQSAPWDSDDWAYKTPSEQASLQAKYLFDQNKAYIDQIASKYGEQIEGLRKMDGREKSILMKALKTAIQNPGVDPEDILNEAAVYAGKSPEELLDIALKAKMDTPEAREKAIREEVEKRMADEKQKWEKDRFNDITVSRRPKFGNRAPDRQAEDRGVIEALAKQGIRLL